MSTGHFSNFCFQFFRPRAARSPARSPHTRTLPTASPFSYVDSHPCYVDNFSFSIFWAPSARTGLPDTEPGTIARRLDPCLHCHSPTVESRLGYVDGTFFNFSLSIVPAPSGPGRTSPRDQWPGGHSFFLSREAFCHVDGIFFKFFTFNFCGPARPGQPHTARTGPQRSPDVLHLPSPKRPTEGPDPAGPGHVPNTSRIRSRRDQEMLQLPPRTARTRLHHEPDTSPDEQRSCISNR